MIMIVEKKIMYEALKGAASAWEKGRTGPGRKIIGTAVLDLSRHLQNLCIGQLADIARKQPDFYAAIEGREFGDYYQFSTNRTALAAVLFLTERERAEMPFSERQEVLKGKSRTIYNHLAKLQSVGFIGDMKQVDKFGNESHNGRTCIMQVNLDFLIGIDKPPMATSDGIDSPAEASFFGEFTEKFSDFTHNIKKENKRKEIANDESESQAIKKEKKTSRELEEKPLSDLEKIEEKSAAGANLPAAGAIWQLLRQMIFAKMVLLGRVRFNCASNCLDIDAKNHKVLANIQAILDRNGEAATRSGVEWWTQWIEEDENRWIYSPAQATSGDYAAGTLQIAIEMAASEKKDPNKNHVLPKKEAKPQRTIDQTVIIFGILEAQGTKIMPGTITAWLEKYGYEHVRGAVDAFILLLRKKRNAGAKKGKEYYENGAYLGKIMKDFVPTKVQNVLGMPKIQDMRTYFRKNFPEITQETALDWYQKLSDAEKKAAKEAAMAAHKLNSFDGMKTNENKIEQVFFVHYLTQKFQNGSN